ncbi:hypothetical protein LTR86_000347 [Recurvomyces mirabilis]|nr:hypothetical protein LTR86_000347 [Recurvomyces mirabilis]
MSEYIGSRISLISKSDIKYIGTLHEINSENHTVALESVTSHGTEGRKGDPAEEISGSDHVYEYIVFRGSDVKELNIVAPPAETTRENERPMPDDPAILGSARPGPPPQQQQQQQQQQLPPQHNQFRGPPPPQQFQQPQQFGYPPPPNQFQGQPRFQGPGGPHGFPGSPGAVPGYGYGPPPPGYGMGYGPPPGQGFQGPPPPGHFQLNHQMPIGPPGQQRPPPHMQQGPPHAPIGSKQSTPQPVPQQAPKPPGLDAQQPQKPIEMSGTPAPSSALTASPAGPPPPTDSKPSTSAALAPPVASQPQQKQNQRPHNNRVAIPLPSPNVLAAKPAQRPAQNAAPQQPPPASAAPQQSVQDATQAATAAVAAAMAKLGATNNQGPQPAVGVDNLSQQVGQMRMHDPAQQQRGRGRGRGAPRGGRRGSAHNQPIEVPKEDYDFEGANAKFRKEEGIASSSPITSPVNGESTAEPHATNGDSEPHVGETEAVIPPPTSGNAKGGAEYDKKKSFFDDISSDLKDRTDRMEGHGGIVDGRAMRREERSRNMETFGQGSVDGFRGGYRRRGGPRGGGRGFDGGRSRGYAGGRGGFEPRGGRGARRGDFGVEQAAV